MALLRNISRNGHSLQLTLPKDFLTALALHAGSTVMVELIGKTIVISRAVSERQLTLGEAKRGAKNSE